MLAYHAGFPGSIPGPCTIFIFFQPAGRTIFRQRNFHAAKHFSVKTLETERRWFSGRMLACHVGGPGAIPGRCTIFIFFQPAGRTIVSSEISTLRCNLVSRRSIGVQW
ncbi:hypothetical protein CEXT_44731 [Caerostris extrusa]|uniref:Uncharacterized protein n=1 Tax=Caerostris extrusa TaxID=172846 RepID=A0AAV4TVA1_CAEEX|nr:hypothetical protein CEXT_44731 [Caerostris extrusa]